MKERIEITRKQFVRWTGILLLLPAAGLWDMMVGRQIALQEEGRRSVDPDDIPGGISRHGDILVYRDGDNIRFFSARCTHLGCSIRDQNDSRWICPCHGSQFSGRTGQVLSGPAAEGLRELDHSVDQETGKWVINLKR